MTKNSKENLGKMALKLKRDFRECKIVKEGTSDNLKPITKAVSIISASEFLNEVLVRYVSKSKLIIILTIVSLLFVNFFGPLMNQLKLTKYLKL
jgi:hypothetical protein